MAVRHMGEPKATHGKNRLHEVFLGGSKLTSFISNFKHVCGYGSEGCSYVNVYNIFSYSSFYEDIPSWTTRGWEFGEGEAETWKWNEVVRAYPVYVSSWM